ncbi:D-alanine--poly(phosphoribitol) ligase subunit 2 [uncultured Roseburia sp.]|uniref:Acyl carrier protein n=1 Tax=Brotonthovivens ammoniilytica TaxID=2981725 RepID=A0ABT2TK34_9FIRM|nr:acyl carrier protein [Brotonthovivens ammoniilytica]MCU6761879.1 acyl carrier protein [Brotonthovivens ammoniilytica]SCI49378.1 D-alanine--poly(phosphoribitol) ligase subunit 2 [uncultured Roseburia sp.]
MKDQIIEILEDLKPGVDFSKEEHLIDDHILESMMMIQLVASLNDEFDVEITPRDIVPENFQSVQAIYDLVERLLEDE